MSNGLVPVWKSPCPGLGMKLGRRAGSLTQRTIPGDPGGNSHERPFPNTRGWIQVAGLSQATSVFLSLLERLCAMKNQKNGGAGMARRLSEKRTPEQPTRILGASHPTSQAGQSQLSKSLRSLHKPFLKQRSLSQGRRQLPV